jgi:hypothetical protein
MNRRRLSLVASVVIAAASAAAAQEITWKKQQLTDKFYAEGMNAADFNKDGKMDVVYGPFWWEGPDFSVRHEIFKPTGKQAEGSWKPDNEYSKDAFFAFTCDFNNDGYPDYLVYAFPGEATRIYLNPGQEGLAKDEPWKMVKVFDVTDNESPQWGDLLGTGKPVGIFHTSDPKIIPPRQEEAVDPKTGKPATDPKTGRPVMKQVNQGALGYAAPDWSDPLKPWTFHPVTKPGGWQRFTHGYGWGDVNGDGKNDIITNRAWWENPGDENAKEWKEHKLDMGPGGAQIYAYDVDGDGKNDIITSLQAHGVGLAWYKQGRKDAGGEISWTPNYIMPPKYEPNAQGIKFSQLHAVDLVDINGDGLKDIVTGKRYFAHGSKGDFAPLDPPVLYWFELKRNPADKTVEWIGHKVDDDSGVGTQVVATDINGDGRPDILVGNKKGAFVFTQERK